MYIEDNGFSEKAAKQNLIGDIALRALTNIFIDSIQQVTFGYHHNYQTLSHDIGKKTLFNEQIFQLQKQRCCNIHSLIAEHQLSAQQWNNNLGLRVNYSPFIDSLVPETRMSIQNTFSSIFSVKYGYSVLFQSIGQILEFTTPKSGFNLENQIWVLASKDDIPLLVSKLYSLWAMINKNGNLALIYIIGL